MPTPTATTTARQERAYQLRMAGNTWADVRDLCGYASTGAAQYAVQAHERRLGIRPTEVRRQRARIEHAVNVAVDAVVSPRFGVEIEVRRPAGAWNIDDAQERIASALRDAGIVARRSGYTHSVTEYWKVTYDSSSDIEVVSPILQGEDGMQQVRVVLRTLKAIGCTVSHAEGLHVHVEVAHLTPAQRETFVRSYVNRRSTIERFLAAHRVTGNAQQWCRALAGRNVSWAVGVVVGRNRVGYRDGRRYHDVNVCSFGQHGTVEFRAHEGSLNGSKVLGWIGLLLGLCQASQAGMTLPAGDEMLDTLVEHGFLTRVRRTNLRRFARSI